MARAHFLAPLLALTLLTALPAAAQEVTSQTARTGNTAPDGPLPTVRLGDFTLRPTLRVDADAGSFFGQDTPGGTRSGVNMRRIWTGVTGTLMPDVTYNVIWDFGGANPNDYGNLYEAQVAYTGFQGVAIRAGAFRLQHMPEFAASSFDLLFFERALITNIAGSLASGTTRTAIGAEANGAIGGGARWNASGYATAGLANSPHDGNQRGLAGRAVLLAVGHPDVQLQFGADVAAQFHPGTNPGPQAVRLRDYPELRVDTRRFLDSTSIEAGSAWAAGPEFSGRLGPAYVEGVWQRVTVNATTGGTRAFEGWYASAALPLRGTPRKRDDRSATWSRPTPTDSLGALELAARYSVADLREGGTGARQSIWTVGLTWFPTKTLRLGAQYENGRTTLSGADRDFQAVGLRASFNL